MNVLLLLQSFILNNTTEMQFRKSIILLFLLLAFLSKQTLSNTPTDQKNDPDRPKIALVLSGGGAKGFSHIGILKMLEKEGIPIDIIVGTSMGNLIGGFYSIGYTAGEIEAIVKKLDWEEVLSDNVQREYLSHNDKMLKQRYLLSLPFSDVKSIGLPQGIIKGQNVLNIFCGLAGNLPPHTDFHQLPISFASVAGDMETGDAVVMKDGFFPTALFASMAIPGVFQPVKRDGLLLVDGGLINNFPVDVAKEMGADIVIGVDIRSDYLPQEKLKSMDEIFGQIVGFMDKEKNAANSSLCDILIRPDISGYSTGSFSREAADTLIIRGEKAALRHMSEIREIKDKYKLQPPVYSREYVVSGKWQITDVRIHGDYHFDKTFLKSLLNLEIPGKYSAEEIKDAIDRLYGHGGFDLAYYYLTNNTAGKTLNLNVVPQKEYAQRVGFKANTVDAAALLLNFTKRNYEKTFSFLSASAEISANPGVTFTAEANRLNFPTLGFELNAKYQNYHIFDSGDKLYNADLFFSSLKTYTYKSFFRHLNVGFGGQLEYFNGDIFSQNTTTISELKTEMVLGNLYSQVSFDNLDNFYFPNHGTRLELEFSLYSDFKNNGNITSALLFNMNKVIPLSPRTVLLFNLHSRTLFDPDFPLVKTTFVGGEPYSQYFNYHMPFIGLSPVTISGRVTNIGFLGLRLQVAKLQYLTFQYNLMVQGNDWREPDDFSTVGGAGVKYSINTLIGPLDVGMGYSEKNKKPTFTGSLGFWF
ncbi:hypothetical protein D1614_11630 [Maribellus luteus]|uniref:PNPLA domain-containing protein n=2 Tax=Maribellus luteus TaxID=2305463 RepID=A0A399T064_9BACT|nr:hypothetical protein D1614_11630 [Maribellus luteus]